MNITIADELLMGVKLIPEEAMLDLAIGLFTEQRVTLGRAAVVNLVSVSMVFNITPESIYRNQALITTLTATTTYTDATIQTKVTYVYQVSTHDVAGNESPQSASINATARKERK